MNEAYATPTAKRVMLKRLRAKEYAQSFFSLLTYCEFGSDIIPFNLYNIGYDRDFTTVGHIAP